MASATEDEVLKYWQGLGYYSRAKNIHLTAKKIVNEFHGIFPSTYKEILSLKGVGKYTAAAIISLAYNVPYATVDTNVIRIISRIFGVKTPVDTATGIAQIYLLADKLLLKSEPGIFNSALMDFGALVCKKVSPQCVSCLLQNYCSAFLSNEVNTLPLKNKTINIKNRFFHYLVFIIPKENSTYTLFGKRNKKDIWNGLYDFPLIETEIPVSVRQLPEYINKFEKDSSWVDSVIGQSEIFKHILTHQIINATFYKITASGNNFFPEAKMINTELLQNYPVSSLIKTFLSKYDHWFFHT